MCAHCSVSAIKSEVRSSTRWFFAFCCVVVATQNKKGRFSRSAPCCLMFESSETSEAGAFSTSDVPDAIATVHKENNERRDKKQDLVQAVMTGNKSEMAGLMMELIDKSHSLG